jgi:hypothetical protein
MWIFTMGQVPSLDNVCFQALGYEGRINVRDSNLEVS